MFKKGKSGNPATQFSSDYQPGRGKKSITSIIRRNLFSDDKFLKLTNVEEIDDDGVPTGRKVNVRIKMVKSDAFVQVYLKRALKSDSVMKDLIDRIDGKALQQVEQIETAQDRQRNLNNFIESLPEDIQESIKDHYMKMQIESQEDQKDNPDS